MKVEILEYISDIKILRLKTKCHAKYYFAFRLTRISGELDI